MHNLEQGHTGLSADQGAHIQPKAGGRARRQGGERRHTGELTPDPGLPAQSGHWSEVENWRRG